MRACLEKCAEMTGTCAPSAYVTVRARTPAASAAPHPCVAARAG